MKTTFWICWVSELIAAIFLSTLLLRLYAAGTVEQHDAKEISGYWKMLFAAVAMLIGSIILYRYEWYKIATLVASVPLIVVIVWVAIPLIAYISGAKMN